MMRLLFLLLFACTFGTLAAQQSAQPVKLMHYVFDSFKEGEVTMRTGQVSKQMVNYNIVTQEMIYDANGKYLAISNPAEVSTIVIEGRTFVPVSEKFFEKLTDTEAPLLVEYTCTITDPGAPVGYGTSSSTTASTSLRALIQNGGAYNLKLPDEFTVVPGANFWINHKGAILKANNLQQMVRVFEDRKQLVRELARKNNTDFKNRADVIMLVNQIHQ